MKYLTNKQQNRMKIWWVRLRQFGYGTEWVLVCLGTG